VPYVLFTGPMMLRNIPGWSVFVKEQIPSPDPGDTLKLNDISLLQFIHVGHTVKRDILKNNESRPGYE
jgi:hypothetical protein